MSGSIERLLVGTRKGLFSVERSHARWAVTDVAFEGDTVPALLPDPRDGALYAMVRCERAQPKLFRSDDGGRKFREVAVPEYPSDARLASGEPAQLDFIWCLETAGSDRPNALWAGTVPGGLFYSPDRGEHWQLVRSLWERPERAHWSGGGLKRPGIHSILVDPRDPNQILIGVSCGGVWQSSDGGASFEPAGKGLDPKTLDPHRLARCRANPDVVWVQHATGVFRSTDAGHNFSALDVQPSGFGYGLAAHPHDAETAWLVPIVDNERRIPVERKLCVRKTRDGGRSFESKTQGLPQQFAYDLVYRHALDVDDSGTLLALGSTTGNLWSSENGGESFEVISHHLPPIYALRFATLRLRSPVTNA